MLLEQLAVVVQQGGDRILRENVVTDLLLHERELLGDVFLRNSRKSKFEFIGWCFGFFFKHSIYPYAKEGKAKFKFTGWVFGVLGVYFKALNLFVCNRRKSKI